jgi:hypothetical protein
MSSTAQSTRTVWRYAGGIVALIVPSVFAWAGEPPPDLARRAATQESLAEEARSHYLYRQTVSIEDFDPKGFRAGEYREIKEIIFSPSGERTEQPVGQPRNDLKRLRLTAEDFRDLREVQPLLLTRETLFLYQAKYRGEVTLDGRPCWLLEIRPRQILDGQRLFDGILWIDQTTFATVRSEGKAVPEHLSTKQENLFPRFTTRRALIDGHWFPVETLGDDVLPFRNGPVRMRLSIQYSSYRRFGAESSITFTDPPSPPK